DQDPGGRGPRSGSGEQAAPGGELLGGGSQSKRPGEPWPTSGPFFAVLRSGRRDLNPRRRPWQGRTLPLSYSRRRTQSGVARSVQVATEEVGPDRRQALATPRVRKCQGLGRESEQMNDFA